MNNDHYIRILSEIAKLAQIAGENKFKVRAFENAARALENLTDPIATHLEAGTITNISGVGKSLAEDIQQIHDTGTCDYHTHLLETLDPGLLDILNIQGLGPKRVKVIYDALGVSNLDAMEEAAKAHRIQELPGLGKKTEERILSEIERLRSHAGRTPLPQARRVAEGIRDKLAALDCVDRIEIAGSIRRERETIGDIDLLVTTTEPAKVTQALVELTEVAEVLASGDTKTSVRLHNGIQLDLRVVQAQVFGSALHYFTGSKDHHIALRTRAKRQGLKISEYGVFAIDSDTAIASQTEAALYKALDLPFIPPELRQGFTEIELAAENRLPELITAEDIRGDLHMHTTETDGRASILEMAEAAKELGYSYIAITDHSQAVTVANGMTAERFEAHIQKIRAANKEIDNFEILSGIEVDILKDGSLDMDHDLLRECDWVVASVHSHFRMETKAMTERLLSAMETGLVSEMGHPTGRILGGRDGYTYDFNAIVEAAVEYGIALEINGSTGRLDLNAELARKAHTLGAKLVLGSDAHSTRGLHALRYALGQARRAGLTANDVLNTLDAPALLASVRPKLG
ncbi:DNA polymerase/3'-5' exonuclease PolX [Bradymonas sediminis]|nr:DNA polymerase/3'-5' exonuclease PolX [Bradymonas sediminis]TDP76456.1 DNA polymerase (family 10) [Bradymonas sediminis]